MEPSIPTKVGVKPRPPSDRVRWRQVNLRNFAPGGKVAPRFLFAQVPEALGLPFAVVSMEGQGRKPNAWRLDLDKGAFLDAEAPESIKALAPSLSDYIEARMP